MGARTKYGWYMKSEYSRKILFFSPEGRISKIEYVIEAIKLGFIAVGIRTREGVILAAETRIILPLIGFNSEETIFEIDEHLASANSACMADARTVMDQANFYAQQHRFTYCKPL